MSVTEESASVEDLIENVTRYLRRHAAPGTSVFVQVDDEDTHGPEGHFTMLSEERLLELQIASLEKKQTELDKRLQDVRRLSRRKRQRRVGGLEATIVCEPELNKEEAVVAPVNVVDS
jgi:hypothetical protein